MILSMPVVFCAALFGCSHENLSESIVDIPPQTHFPTPSPSFATATPTIMTEESPAATIAVTAPPEITAKPVLDEKSYPTDDEAFYYMPLNDEIKNRITGMSFPSEDEDCLITYDDLRYVSLLYCDFEAEVHVGELIVNRKVAKEVTMIFYELYQNKYPLASVRLVDDYKEPGDDNLSMADNNSSAFNYRRVTGSKNLSRHSYGAAVDINPLFNPYIDGDRVAPPNAEAYANRDWDFPGKIDHNDLCYQLFIRNGWTWGGDWKGDKDYQHFSKDMGY